MTRCTNDIKVQKKEIDEDSKELILEVHEEQKLGARRLEKIIEFKYGTHIPHNRIHQVLLKSGLLTGE